MIDSGVSTPDPADDAAWRRFYSASEVVAIYRRDERLQPAEATILSLLGADLAQARLLDVGVGGGRTTAHLASACLHYRGVDYAEGMVAVCQERFRDAAWYAPESFRQADARSLPFEDDSFDIVLFSFNGLDHVPPEARATALAQCQRVLRPGGWFIYSGHNLNWFDGPGLPPRSAGWRAWIDELRYRRRTRQLNQGTASTQSLGAASLRDPPDGLRLHYARPAEHLRELQASGLGEARVFNRRGREITRDADMKRVRDTWVYYLARRTGG